MHIGNILNKVTKEYISEVNLTNYIPDVNNNTTNWLINPNVMNVIGTDSSLWQIDLDTNGNLICVRRMTTEELDVCPLLVASAKQDQIDLINQACTDGIVGGVISSALGSPHLYDANVVDQVNIVAAIITTLPTAIDPFGATIFYACRDINTLQKSYVEHTNVQLRQILADGAIIKVQQLITATTKKYYISMASSVSQVKAITWSSTP